MATEAPAVSGETEDMLRGVRQCSGRKDKWSFYPVHLVLADGIITMTNPLGEPSRGMSWLRENPKNQTQATLMIAIGD